MPDLKINLPHCRREYHMAGVYKIAFDTGEFYIGSSNDLWSRAYGWRSIFEHPEKEYKKYAMGNAWLSRIRDGGVAMFDILELCNSGELREREAEYLSRYENDPLMLSKASCSWKPVLQYKNDGHFIKRHISITAAAKYNSFKISKVQMVLNGERQSYKGMRFIYESDYQKPKRKYKPVGQKKEGRMIVRLDLDGNKIDEFTTVRAAAKFARVSTRSISAAINGERNSAAGYRWSFGDLRIGQSHVRRFKTNPDR